MKKKLAFSLILLLVFTLIISCQKKSVKAIDARWYVLDDFLILMLIESSEQDTGYINAIKKIKGNTNELITVIEELNHLGDNVKIQNAIGVAYLRLREFDSAKTILNQALETAETEEERVCILTNLIGVESYLGYVDKQDEYVKAVAEINVKEPIRNLVAKSNLTRLRMEQNMSGGSTNLQAKALLKEEKKSLGSNQLIGIYNYKTLALGCYYDNRLENGVKYIKKAQELNNSLYQDVYTEGNLCYTMSFMYYYQGYNQEALDYSEQYISTLESWQTDDHYDVLSAYQWRGNVYLNNQDMEKAMSDYELVLERCPWDHKLAGVSYYNMAIIHTYNSDTNKAEEDFAKSYVIMEKYQGENEIRSEIKDKMLTLYETGRYRDKGVSFEQWFSTKKQLAEKTIMEEDS